MRNCNECRKRKGALSQGKERSYIFSSFNPLTTDTFYGLLIISVCIVEANPQQENNFVFLSPFHSVFVIYTPSMLSERVSVSSCSEKETMCFVTR